MAAVIALRAAHQAADLPGGRRPGRGGAVLPRPDRSPCSSSRPAATAINAPRTLDSWTAIITSTPAWSDAIIASLELAVITSIVMLVLLLPTMVWVRLRLPRPQPHRRVHLPAAAHRPGDRAGRRASGRSTSGSASTSPTRSSRSSFAYLILVLPYAYRSLDAGLGAIDLKTLSEAARSLGAGWVTVMLRSSCPTSRRAILNASLLSVALVLGEYTVREPAELREPAGRDRVRRPGRRRHVGRRRGRLAGCSRSCC